MPGPPALLVSKARDTATSVWPGGDGRAGAGPAILASGVVRRGPSSRANARPLRDAHKQPGLHRRPPRPA